MEIKTKYRIALKETLSALSVGDTVEIKRKDAKSEAIRIAASRFEARTFTVSDKGNYCLVTRIS